MEWPKTDDPNNLVNFNYTINLAEEYAGNDTLVNFENVDYIGEYNSEITGDNNDNFLSAGSGDDILKGGAGNDILNAGAGNDFLYGEDGNDTLILGGSGYTVFDGGEGVDTVIVDIFSSGKHDIIVDFENAFFGNDSEIIDPRYDTFTNVENFEISGTDNDVIMTGDDNDNILTTDGGNDVINGGDGNDILYGGSGNDTLSTGSGNDQLFGGLGDDTLIINGTGDSVLDGGDGIDTFKVDMSHYVPPEGDTGFTYLANLSTGFAGSKNEPEHVNNDDLINIENIDYNGLINAELIGNDGDNVIEGGSGNDYLYGGDGNDILKPWDGDDYIYGEAGNDILTLTGSGTQIFDGGEGVDTFKLDGLMFEGPLDPNYEQIVSINLVTGISGQKG